MKDYTKYIQPRTKPVRFTCHITQSEEDMIKELKSKFKINISKIFRDEIQQVYTQLIVGDDA